MPVRIGPNRKATLGTAPIIFAALLLSPPVAAAFTGGAFLLSNRVLGRRWINSAYNAAQVVLITLVAGLAGGPLSRLDPFHVLRAVLAAVLLTATSTLLAGIAIALFRKGGPYPYAKDGSIFGNREALLPRQKRGYCREYTVKTPHERTRGARRIIAGSGGDLYYTEDHYNHFRRIRE